MIYSLLYPMFSFILFVPSNLVSFSKGSYRNETLNPILLFLYSLLFEYNLNLKKKRKYCNSIFLIIPIPILYLIIIRLFYFFSSRVQIYSC